MPFSLFASPDPTTPLMSHAACKSCHIATPCSVSHRPKPLCRAAWSSRCAVHPPILPPFLQQTGPCVASPLCLLAYHDRFTGAPSHIATDGQLQLHALSNSPPMPDCVATPEHRSCLRSVSHRGNPEPPPLPHHSARPQGTLSCLVHHAGRLPSPTGRCLHVGATLPAAGTMVSSVTIAGVAW
jgi:hypothetical protein